MAKRSINTMLAVVAACLVSAGTATAVTPAMNVTIGAVAFPSGFSAADTARCLSTVTQREGVNVLCDAYRVTVRETGSVGTVGPLTLTDSLPPGLTARRVIFYWSGLENGQGAKTDLAEGLGCTTTPVRCTFPIALEPGQTLTMMVYTTVDSASQGSLTDTAAVSGGGVAEASTSVQNEIGVTPPFGASLTSYLSGLDGAPDTQAGDHPYEYALRIELNDEFRFTPNEGDAIEATSVQDVKDVVIDLPLGFLGSTRAAPQCTFAQLSSHISNGVGGCPVATEIGQIVTLPDTLNGVHGPLYNMVPEHGAAAEFGFVDVTAGAHVLYSSVVPTPAGYVLRTTSPDIPQIAMSAIEVTLFGDPAARDESGNNPVALFTNPSQCTGEPLKTSIHLDSWQSPGSYNADGTPDFNDPNWAAGTAESPPVTGCDQLQFEGSIGAQLETAQADSPSGLGFELKVPQSEDPGTLATPPLRKAVVTLPAGVSVNPSSAGGLQACSPAQIGLGSNAQPTCPEASKIGVVELTTPLLAGVLQGSVYLATQGENPFHSLLAMYMVVDDPTTGVLIKSPGRIDPDPATGQLTTTFDELPQFQFSDLKLHLFGGARAPLSTPAGCGTYTTTSSLTPWSAPDSGPPAEPSDSFQISTGCVTGFNPSFSAGTTDNQAGAFGPFTLTLSRGDQDQNLAGITVTTPPGLLGVLKGVERCPEPQASQGTCGQSSLIGHTTVAAGTGPDPYWVQGGQVFLTGPYKGAPFGLSIVVPAVAGPFNLGNVVVRAAISIDPHTAQITVASDPLPTILQGIPLDIRTVNVTIDRAGFMFNPTNCESLSVGGTLSSTQGATADVSSHFQAANCANLPFRPLFAVSTQAATSKKKGASLIVKGTFPAGEANIHSVAVTLPKQLPARLTTIQQACTEAVFNANPASCPVGSNIGTATARTPILANPVVGPVYLVSHGSAAFPDVVAILQGEGVTVDLVGSIDIKHNITSSTFAAIPDAPIASFALTLPEGPHSGLAAVVPAKAKGNLCGQSLTMPFTITGQNGAVVKQTVKIAVTGCPRAKKKAKARKPKGKRKKG